MTEQQIEIIRAWQDVYADNTDPYDYERGILAYSHKFFGDQIKAIFGTSKTQIDIYREFLGLYDPNKRFLQERQVQLVVYRGGAKSTCVNLICGSYVVCHNGRQIILENGTKGYIDEELVVLASETNTFAANWVNSIRTELSSNHELKRYYGDMKPSKIKDEEGKWRSDVFIALRSRLPNPFAGKTIGVIGRGAGQQIRGLNIKGRPTLFIPDDIYSAKGIITIESRDKTRYWFFNEAINTLDNITGKVFSIGTVVHEDTVVVDNMNNPLDWKTLIKPMMPVDKFNYILDNYCKVNRDLKTCEIPSREVCEQLEREGYESDWKEKFPLESLLLKFRGAIMNSTESGFWQELFHLTIAESDKVFKKSSFVVRELDIVTKQIRGHKVLFVSTIDRVTGEIVYRNITSFLAIDSASSKMLGSAKTAHVWVGMDYYKNIYVLHSSSARYGIEDEYENGIIVRKGSANEAFRILGIHAGTNVKIGVEVYNVGNATIDSLKKLMLEGADRLVIFPVTQIDNKEERILQTLSKYYQSKSVVHNINQEELKKQLEYLGKAKDKDEADAYEIAVRYLRPPHVEISYDTQETVTKEFLSPFQHLLPNKNITKDKWKTH